MGLSELMVMIILIYAIAFNACIYVKICEYVPTVIEYEIDYVRKIEILIFAKLEILKCLVSIIIKIFKTKKITAKFHVSIDTILSFSKIIDESIVSATKLVLLDIK
jgi:putative component of membrane protein insertase Oxa1/YidC/SpoIIIJ protein YidD